MDVEIICMACKTQGIAPLGRVASLRCRCGAQDFDLVMEADSRFDRALDAINDTIDKGFDWLEMRGRMSEEEFEAYWAKRFPNGVFSDEAFGVHDAAKTAAAEKMVIRFKAIGNDPWDFLHDLLGTVSTDYVEPKGSDEWVAQIKVPPDWVDEIFAYVQQGRLISAEQPMAAAAALVTAAPVMVEKGTSTYDNFIRDGWSAGREQQWDRATYIYMIPPGETDDQADAMFKTRYRDKPPVVVERDAPGSRSPRSLDRLSPAATLTVAAWGIFRAKDNTPVYGPAPKDAVDIAMASGRYGDEFYAGTMPDIPQPLELGGDPFRDVGDSIETPTYDDGLHRVTKITQVFRAIRANNPEMAPLQAHAFARQVVDRYFTAAGDSDPSVTPDEIAQYKEWDAKVYEYLREHRDHPAWYSSASSHYDVAIAEGIVPAEAKDLAYRVRGRRSMHWTGD